MDETIQKIQTFGRFYGALFGEPSGPLPGDLSDTEARVISALAGEEGLTARAIMKLLGVDAGYLSRLLAGFEARKLIKRERSRRDKRAVMLSLTPRGATLAAEIDAQVQAHIRQRIAGLDGSARQALVEAMQQIQTQCRPERRAAPLIFRQLRLGDIGWIVHRHATLIAVENGWDERFEAMCAGILADFVRHYDARYERSWIAERDGRILGSLFLVRVDAHTAKLRMLYVEKEVRGMGLAGKLMEKSFRFARDKGYQRVQLFTTSENTVARRMYEKLGFRKLSEAPTDLFGNGLMGEEWELVL